MTLLGSHLYLTVSTEKSSTRNMTGPFTNQQQISVYSVVWIFREKKKAGTLTAEKEEYQEHIQRKQESRFEKPNDKKAAIKILCM